MNNKKMRSIKYYLITVILLFIVFSNSYSQWYPLNSGTINNLTSVFFLDNNKGFICGDSGTILKTTNGGANWQFLILNPVVNNIFTIRPIDINTIFIIANIGNINRVLKTTDGGNSWDTTGSPPNATSMFFLNSTTGWLRVGQGPGQIFKTVNCGLTWSFMGNLFYNCILNGFFFTNDNTGFLCGYYKRYYTPYLYFTSALIFKTFNSGINWSLVYQGEEILGGPNCISKIQFINNFGYGIGFDSTSHRLYFLKSFDTGNTWFRSNILSNANSFKFISEAKGWTVGNLGVIYYTSNAGVNWLQQASNTNADLTDLFIMDSLTGWACGKNGEIIKTTNGGTIGINKISNEVPQKFSLSQNYPNPFNPYTKIKFSFPADSRLRGNDNVVLKVYDALGREVQTLVNEHLNPGTYEIDFDGTNFASGVYYYTFSSGDPSAPLRMTKKMALIK